MTLKEMLCACSEAGLTCGRDKVLFLTREGLLDAPTGGSRGKGNAAAYSERTLLRLLVILWLEQSPPAGFGIGRVEDRRSWLGTVGERTVDDFLPAVAFLLGIPGAGADKAREAASEFFRNVYAELQADRPSVEALAREQPELSVAQAIGEVGAGNRAYRDPAIFAIPDVRDESSPTLLDEVSAFYPEWLRPQFEGSDMAMIARISSPALRLRALARAPEALLAEAAYWVRALGCILADGPGPKMERLLHFWGFLVTVLYYSPETRGLFHCFRSALNGADLGFLVKLAGSQECQRSFATGNLDALAMIAAGAMTRDN